MPSLTDEIGIALWRRASQAEIGIAIATKDKPLLRSELYRIRKELANGQFDDIVIFNPKGPELFLCRKTVELP